MQSTSGVGLFFRRHALDMARRVARTGGVLHRVFDLFILRATGDKKNRRGRTTIVEVPPILLGGFGGKNGTTDYYTPSVGVSFGALVDALVRTDLRHDPDTGSIVPYKSDAEMRLSLPVGSGRLAVGDVPPWSGYRQALNNTTGVSVLYPSAVLVAVCPSLTTESGEHPYPRTLFICRSSPTMLPGLPLDASAAPIVTPDTPAEALPLAGHPAVSGAVPVGPAARIAGLEFSAESFGADEADELRAAGPALEWGPLRGLATVHARRYDADRLTVTGDVLYLVGYEVDDAGEEATGSRYTLQTGPVSIIDGAALPTPPDGISAVAAVPEVAEYTFPAWVEAHCLPNGRAAASGRMTLRRDINAFLRVWAPSAGVDGPRETSLLLVEVAVTHDTTTTVSATGYKNGTSGVAFATVAFRAAGAQRVTTYAVRVTPDGALMFRALADFTDDRYATGGALTRQQYQAYLGVTTGAGDARLVCTRWAVPYEVRDADPNGPAPYSVQGEPARRVPVDGYAHVLPTDLSLVLVGGASDAVVDLGSYYPAVGSLNTSAVGEPPYPAGRENFGDTAFNLSGDRYGSDGPAPFCQYAPGVLLAIVHPVSAFTNDTWPLAFAVIDAGTGEVLQLIGSTVSIPYNSRVMLTCMQQATVDEAGAIARHGTLMLTVSTLTTGEGRTDGTWMIHDMERISWLCREPSNVPLAYAGNTLAPATLGVSTNLLSL